MAKCVRKLLLLLSISLILLGTSCYKGVSPSVSEVPFVEGSWGDVRIVPVSGQVSAIEGQELMFQHLFVCSKDTFKTYADMGNISLRCKDGTVIYCEQYGVSGGEGGENISLYTISFFATIPAQGTYEVVELIIEDKNEGKNVFEIANMEIVSSSAKDYFEADKSDLQMVEQHINPYDYSSYTVTFLNNADVDITVGEVSLPDKYYSRIIVAQLYDGLGKEESMAGLVIPAKEERAVEFTFEFKSPELAAEMEKMQFFYLPYFSYEINGVKKSMVAQYQPSYYEPLLSEEYLAGILAG